MKFITHSLSVYSVQSVVSILLSRIIALAIFPAKHLAWRVHIEIVNTGTELLLGNTLNTHGAWLGAELFKLGLRVARQTCVPDGEAIREVLVEALGRADVVLVTGGLGPTSDDLTREITAEVLGLDLVQDAAALASLEAFFAIRERPMASDNLKQVLIPRGALALPNPNGTAPGVYVAGRPQGAIFLLPGPPRELQPMFLAEVAPRLRSLSGVAVPPELLELKFTGVGESDFHQALDAHLAGIPGLEFGYCARLGEVDLRLIGSAAALQQARALAMQHFAPQFVSDDGSSLEQTLLRSLSQRGWTLATAESCSGGLIASRLTDVAGASAVFTHGFVTYSNAAKKELLGVAADILDTHGAVSEPVARQMAEGALTASGADIAVAVTGIAGPSGGSPDKPLGTAWIAVAQRHGATRAWRVFQPRNRLDFKQGVSQAALDGLRQCLLDRRPED
ncbi:MAG: competence/damage-inducible protein A [Verrucomicrobia bacterium]|nr:MAG: competence/damage-inducible protein A [Verrucomicrobiota bacterium]